MGARTAVGRVRRQVHALRATGGGPRRTHTLVLHAGHRRAASLPTRAAVGLVGSEIDALARAGHRARRAGYVAFGVTGFSGLQFGRCIAIGLGRPICRLHAAVLREPRIGGKESVVRATTRERDRRCRCAYCDTTTPKPNVHVPSAS
jgi:hypothetical protein